MSDLFAVQIRQESLLWDIDSIMKSFMSEANEFNSLFSFSYYLKGKTLSKLYKNKQQFVYSLITLKQIFQ